MKKFKNTIVKKTLNLLYLLLKPFIPYIIIFLTVFFFIILIIDAIFIEFSNENGDLLISEQEIQSYCENASKSNYNIYLDGKISTESITVSNEETSKAISLEQLYSLLLFQNITNNKEITSQLAYNIANEFKSKYYYKTSKIITETKITDDEGNVSWQVTNKETVKLLTESITISGHYKYNYVEETKEERRY